MHMRTESQSKFGKIRRYFSCMLQTWRLISQENPEHVWLQLPPNFLVHIVLLYRGFSRKKFKVVADCHNASLRPPWSSLPLSIWAMNRCDLVLVHNEDVFKDALVLGVDADRLLVLEDAPAYVFDREKRFRRDGGHVLVPCSFHDDEPVHELLAAARLCPDVPFKITGPIRKAVAKGYTVEAPENVEFTGFVSVEEYDTLVWDAGVILGLTTMDGIQLSVAGEALGAGRPLLLSDTQTLRALFGEGAVFVENTAEGLSSGIRKAFEINEDMAAASRACGAARYEAWKTQAEAVKKRLS